MSKDELMEKIDSLKEELSQLRVAQVSGGAPAKVCMIKVVRKNIARIYTIITYLTREKVREECIRQKKMLPLDLRPQLTRKERLAIPKHLKNKKTPREKRAIAKYPQRKFAVINRRLHLPPEVVKANVKAVLSGKKDSRYRHYLIRKQKALQFMKTNLKHCRYMADWEDATEWKSHRGKDFKEKVEKHLRIRGDTKPSKKEEEAAPKNE